MIARVLCLRHRHLPIPNPTPSFLFTPNLVTLSSRTGIMLCYTLPFSLPFLTYGEGDRGGGRGYREPGGRGRQEEVHTQKRKRQCYLTTVSSLSFLFYFDFFSPFRSLFHTVSSARATHRSSVVPR
eukprot:gene9304-6543_t